MKRLLIAACLALAGCASLGVHSPAQGLYAGLYAYDGALKAAATYAELPTASPSAVHKIRQTKDAPATQRTVAYARAYVACKGNPTGTVGPVNCALFDFSSGTAAGYASALNAVVTVLIQSTGGVK